MAKIKGSVAIQGFVLATILWILGLAVTVSFGVIAGARFAPFMAAVVVCAISFVHAFFMYGPGWIVEAVIAEILWFLASTCFLAGFMGGLQGGFEAWLVGIAPDELVGWGAFLLFTAMVPLIVAARMRAMLAPRMVRMEETPVEKDGEEE